MQNPIIHENIDTSNKKFVSPMVSSNTDANFTPSFDSNIKKFYMKVE